MNKDSILKLTQNINLIIFVPIKEEILYIIYIIYNI